MPTSRTCLVLLTLTTLVLTCDRAAAQEPRWDRPNPAVIILRKMAGGSMAEADLRNALAYCQGPKAQLHPACQVSLPDILFAVARESPENRALVERELGEWVHGSESGHAGRLGGLLDVLRDDAAITADTVLPGMRAETPTRGRFADAPPCREARGDMTDNAWEARLLSFLNARLPEKEPERTRAALRIASEKQCQAIAGIVGERDCKCLGVHWITWASLWLATDDLKGSRGKPEIVSRFVGMDSEVLEKALHRGQVGSDERLQGRIDLIRRWLVRRPANQWEAWADVEDILGDTW